MLVEPEIAMRFKRERDYLYHIKKELIRFEKLSEKLSFLEKEERVVAFLKQNPCFMELVQSISQEFKVLVLSLIVIEQASNVLKGFEEDSRALNNLLQKLLPVDSFYQSIGGLIGYHYHFLDLLTGHSRWKEEVNFQEPPGVDIGVKDDKTKAFTLWGIEALSKMGEIYPIGGAGDRFGLIDPDTKEALPIALLTYKGVTLLEGLFRDLQGREYLAYKLQGEQSFTPVAIMTSSEKRNFEHIDHICRKQGYFGRGRGHIVLMKQPMVPVITDQGDWSLSAPLTLHMKPGGHGVLWRVCAQARVYEWMGFHKRGQVLVRQINNPTAGVDDGLLTFVGYGFHEKKHFGFASCHRPVGVQEGVNVLFQSKEGVQGITNIEYAEFEQNGIKDVLSEGSKYSKYPANTNILYADLDAVEHVVRHHPVPGMLVNLRGDAPYINAEGILSYSRGGRLESMMQNIADYFGNKVSEEMSSYVTFNARSKTISVTKKPYCHGETIEGTPMGAFYTDCKNNIELLTASGFQVPDLPEREVFVEQKAPFYMQYHPALGPSFEVIKQKISRGTISEKSCLVLEIAELEILNLNLDGTLQIKADAPLGFTDTEGKCHFSEESNGKCSLKNVTVINKGLDSSYWEAPWSGELLHVESCSIEIEGNGEFFAENITIKGAMEIKVPNGYKVTLFENASGELEEKRELLNEGASWFWKYEVGEDQSIVVHKQSLIADRTSR